MRGKKKKRGGGISAEGVKNMMPKHIRRRKKWIGPAQKSILKEKEDIGKICVGSLSSAHTNSTVT